MGVNNPFSIIDEADARRWLGLECFRRAPIEGPPEGILEGLSEQIMSSSGS